MSNKLKRAKNGQHSTSIAEVLATAEVVSAPVIEVDVNAEIATTIGNQAVELMKLRQAANQLLQRATTAEAARDAAIAERDALRARVEAMSAS